MHFFNLLFILFGLLLQTTTIFAYKKNKKHRFKPFTTKVQRACAVNKELKKVRGEENWPQRQAIIRHALAHRGVNPDALRVRNGYEPDTPLSECVQLQETKQDLEYTEFLLRGCANPRALHKLGKKVKPLLFFARTVEMATMLMRYGAHRDVQIIGPELLNDVWREEKEAALIPLFVLHGARVDKMTQDGSVPLISLLEQADISVDKVRFFMQAGVPLELRCQNPGPNAGHTVPQYLKQEIENLKEKEKECQEEECCGPAIERLGNIRTLLIGEQEKRNIHFAHNAIPMLLPPLRSIVGSYGGPFSSYQELEEEPVPLPVYSPRLLRQAGSAQ